MLNAIRTKAHTMIGTINGRVCELPSYSRSAANSTRPKFISAAMVLSMASLLATEAHAALPTIIGTTLDGVETDALALADLVWPVLVGLFGVVLLMKLFKRLSGKI